VKRAPRILFGLSPHEVTFGRRGFHESDPDARERLENIGLTFLHGYHAALDGSLYSLASQLSKVERELQGFAFEGAAMALALLDILTPWKKDRWPSFLSGPGGLHKYMVHVGYGWALARLNMRVEKALSRMDPLLGWLAVDGYGFHEGYFHPRRYLVEHSLPAKLSGYACRVFDQGLGRSLWFAEGADVSRIPSVIASFPPTRQADLWSGIGLACAYAGGVDGAGVKILSDAAGENRFQMAQGAAFAAKARQRAGNPAPHTSIACQVLCGTSAEEAAQWTDLALADLKGLSPGVGGELPAYEVWRQGVRERAAIRERTAREVQTA
jgi:hypothetical protein